MVVNNGWAISRNVVTLGTRKIWGWNRRGTGPKATRHKFFKSLFKRWFSRKKGDSSTKAKSRLRKLLRRSSRSLLNPGGDVKSLAKGLYTEIQGMRASNFSVRSSLRNEGDPPLDRFKMIEILGIEDGPLDIIRRYKETSRGEDSVNDFLHDDLKKDPLLLEMLYCALEDEPSGDLTVKPTASNSAPVSSFPQGQSTQPPATQPPATQTHVPETPKPAQNTKTADASCSTFDLTPTPKQEPPKSTTTTSTPEHPPKPAPTSKSTSTSMPETAVGQTQTDGLQEPPVITVEDDVNGAARPKAFDVPGGESVVDGDGGYCTYMNDYKPRQILTHDLKQAVFLAFCYYTKTKQPAKAEQMTIFFSRLLQYSRKSLSGDNPPMTLSQLLEGETDDYVEDDSRHHGKAFSFYKFLSSLNNDLSLQLDLSAFPDKLEWSKPDLASAQTRFSTIGSDLLKLMSKKDEFCRKGTTQADGTVKASDKIFYPEDDCMSKYLLNPSNFVNDSTSPGTRLLKSTVEEKKGGREFHLALSSIRESEFKSDKEADFESNVAKYIKEKENEVITPETIDFDEADIRYRAEEFLKSIKNHNAELPRYLSEGDKADLHEAIDFLMAAESKNVLSIRSEDITEDADSSDGDLRFRCRQWEFFRVSDEISDLKYAKYEKGKDQKLLAKPGVKDALADFLSHQTLGFKSAVTEGRTRSESKKELIAALEKEKLRKLTEMTKAAFKLQYELKSLSKVPQAQLDSLGRDFETQIGVISNYDQMQKKLGDLTDANDSLLESSTSLKDNPELKGFQGELKKHQEDLAAVTENEERFLGLAVDLFKADVVDRDRFEGYLSRESRILDEHIRFLQGQQKSSEDSISGFNHDIDALVKGEKSRLDKSSSLADAVNEPGGTFQVVNSKRGSGEQGKKTELDKRSARVKAAFSIASREDDFLPVLELFDGTDAYTSFHDNILRASRTRLRTVYDGLSTKWESLISLRKQRIAVLRIRKKAFMRLNKKAIEKHSVDASFIKFQHEVAVLVDKVSYTDAQTDSPVYEDLTYEDYRRFFAEKIVDYQDELKKEIQHEKVLGDIKVTVDSVSGSLSPDERAFSITDFRQAVSTLERSKLECQREEFKVYNPQDLANDSLEDLANDSLEDFNAKLDDFNVTDKSPDFVAKMTDFRKDIAEARQALDYDFLKSKKRTLDERRKKIDALRKQLEGENAEIVALRSQLKTKKEAVTALRKGLKEAGVDIQALRTQLEGETEDIKALRTQLKVETGAIKALRTQLKSETEAMKALRAQFKEADVDPDLPERIALLDTDLLVAEKDYFLRKSAFDRHTVFEGLLKPVSDASEPENRTFDSSDILEQAKQLKWSLAQKLAPVIRRRQYVLEQAKKISTPSSGEDAFSGFLSVYEESLAKWDVMDCREDFMSRYICEKVQEFNLFCNGVDATIEKSASSSSSRNSFRDAVEEIGKIRLDMVSSCTV